MSKASNPLFFIVTPSFNQGKFIEQTINSVISQHNVEVVYWIVDGGSTDTTKKVLSRFSDVNVISEPDKGQTDAINKGIKLLIKEETQKKFESREIIFAYVNSDDYYLPNAFEKVAHEFQQSPEKQWLVGDCHIVNQTNREIQTSIRYYKKMWRYIYRSAVLDILNPIPQPATFIRWSAVKQTGTFNAKLRYVMDYEYWLRLQARYGNPLMLSDALAAFRIHPQSKGGERFNEQFDEQQQVAKQMSVSAPSLLLQKMHNKLITSIYTLIK